MIRLSWYASQTCGVADQVGLGRAKGLKVEVQGTGRREARERAGVEVFIPRSSQPMHSTYKQLVSHTSWVMQWLFILVFNVDQLKRRRSLFFGLIFFL